MTAPEVARLLHGRKAGRDTWLARCPAHSDSRPSLQIKAGRKAVLLKCWSGCTTKEVVSAAGLKMADLWYEQRTDPKAIRESNRERLTRERVRNRMVSQLRHRLAELECWSRMAAALYWHLLRKPDDEQICSWYEEALDSCLGDPAPWPKHQPYCPFPPQKLLHGIKAHHVTPEIAKFLKL